MRTTLAFVFIASLSTTSLAQTTAECLQTFNVDQNKQVSYIATDQTDTNQVTVNSMSCVDAELLREELFVNMDQSLYDSEDTIRGSLTDADTNLAKLVSDLNKATSDEEIDAALSGGTATLATLVAASSITTCASGLIDGAGLVACGKALTASFGTVVAWRALIKNAQDIATKRKAALQTIAAQQKVSQRLQQDLDATDAANIRKNRADLFIGICRAVQKQCL
jgi:hypothetical protein